MLPTTASVLDQSLWWLVPYAVLILLMVYAMMEFTVTLLQRPPANRKPVAGDELRRRLLALNKPDHPHPLVVGQDCDLEMRWQHEDSRRSRFALSRHSSSSHMRFLLDEQRHELRMHQVDSGSGFFLGLEGWLPRLQGYASMSAGPPEQMLTRDISHLAYRCGWTVRPVLWWFQATHSGSRALQALTPTRYVAGQLAGFGERCIHSVIFWASVIWSLSSARWIGTPCWCSSASPPAGGASGVFWPGR